MQQTTFVENIVTKGDIAKMNNFFFFHNVFIFLKAIIPSFIKIFHVFAQLFSNTSAEVMLYVVYGYKHDRTC